MSDENDQPTILSLIITNVFTTVTSRKNNYNQNRRLLPLLLGIGAVPSAILTADTAIYISKQLFQIKN